MPIKPIPDQLYCPKDGSALTVLPRWETNFQLGYDHPLTGNWDLAARQTLAESPKPNVPAVSDFNEPKSLVDFVLAFIEQDRGVELKLWVKNIADEDLNVDPVQFEETQTLEGRHYPGREYGVTAS